MSGPTWLAKLRRYGGGESILSRHNTHLAAQEVVHDWNTRYQTDSAYVEKYDPFRASFPVFQQVHSEVGRRIKQNFIHPTEPHTTTTTGRDHVLKDLSHITWGAESAEGVRIGHYGATHGYAGEPTDSDITPKMAFPPLGENSTWSGGFSLVNDAIYITEYIDHKPVIAWVKKGNGDWVGTPYA